MTGVDKGSICELRDHLSNKLSNLDFELLGASIERIVAH